jgi:2-iminobutanoate/2-iminopropanoate deaminase
MMISTALNPASVPASPFYSQGIEIRDAGRLVFVAGQVGMTADGTVLQGIQAQAVQAIANLSAILEEAGMSPADVVKVTVYLTDPTDLDPFAAAFVGADFRPRHLPPAYTVLIVYGLASPELLVEVEAVAAR